jgi:hypothetical protein
MVKEIELGVVVSFILCGKVSTLWTGHGQEIKVKRTRPWPFLHNVGATRFPFPVQDWLHSHRFAVNQ